MRFLARTWTIHLVRMGLTIPDEATKKNARPVRELNDYCSLFLLFAGQILGEKKNIFVNELVWFLFVWTVA